MITANVKTEEVCARFHPNSFSSGVTNMLHAYSVPSASVINTPPTNRHQRLIEAASPLRLTGSDMERPETSPGVGVNVINSLLD